MSFGKKLQRVCVMGAAPILAAVLLVGLLAVARAGIVRASEGALHGDVQFPLIVGTSLNPTGTNHDIYEIDVTNDLSQTITSSIPVFGATYDAANDRVLFTSSAGSSAGDQLWELSASGTLTNLGTIVDVSDALPQRIDGLAISGGVLYGSFAGATIEDGIWTIDMDTLSATLALPIADSISGIDADPNTGALYGVNDSKLSLVQIDVAGAMITQVVGYPIGETDIDGLAISDDGRAYMVIDEPGSIHVYNLNTDAYEAPLTAPWTSSDTFSGGAYIFESSIAVTKTVGLDPGVCATTDVLEVVSPGADVTYCYMVQNTGNLTLTTHDLVDDQLGTLLSDFPYNLGPGASVWLTSTTHITQPVTNVMTWTASTASMLAVTATDMATVTVASPGIVVTKTVGLDPGACATTDVLHVDPPSADVTYCYTVQNTGNVTLTTHDVVDDKLGVLLSDFAFDLSPGNTHFFTTTTPITQPVTNVVTWTASISNTSPVTATATATVTEDAFIYWLPAIFRR